MAKTNTEMNWEEMSLLGEKLALMKTQNIIITEIEKVNKKLNKIEKQKMLNKLKGEEA
tara:strand:- start:1361 stop:1534 length:174 start_codon:yes stop_codon:yes gene_type:complete